MSDRWYVLPDRRGPLEERRLMDGAEAAPLLLLAPRRKHRTAIGEGPDVEPNRGD